MLNVVKFKGRVEILSTSKEENQHQRNHSVYHVEVVSCFLHETEEKEEGVGAEAEGVGENVNAQAPINEEDAEEQDQWCGKHHSLLVELVVHMMPSILKSHQETMQDRRADKNSFQVLVGFLFFSHLLLHENGSRNFKLIILIFFVGFII